MLKNLSNLYKRILLNVNQEDTKKSLFHLSESLLSEKLSKIFVLKESEAIAFINWKENTLLGYKHKESFNMITASKGISSILQAEVLTIKNLDLDAKVEDIAIVLNTEIHIIYVLKAYPSFCLYFVFNPSYSNLVLAKSMIASLANELSAIQHIALEKLTNKEEE
ncbi:hypothetical protein MNB_SV-13-596 [hydrothermal vent metagenome]|uniref:Roadblock/LAMTOR2 domain-containing protein n=1 Tax=hydrothermal vent metagenome TaxID=652676 RepID=A0A1W1CJN4_9ZZZZ